MIERNKIYKTTAEDLIKLIPDNSVDVIPIDPPYLYLKNQKLEREFDEQFFFSECKRILKNDGFIILFGRGSSFYRWNTILANLGFVFKEEIIWNKSYCTSPLMNISRVHETVSIHTKKSGLIRKVKIPYLEMKGHDLDSIVADIKRLKTTFKNTKSFDAVIEYLETNYIDTSPRVNGHQHTVSSNINTANRATSVMSAIQNGLNEKTIINTGFNHIAVNKQKLRGDCNDRDRSINVINSIAHGMNEKTIIKEIRDHHTAIHPTQKPVRLIERLLQLVINPNRDLRPLAATFFSGSGAHEEACVNLGIDFIGCEIDDEYHSLANERIEKHLATPVQGLIKYN